jgi:hypothetical protein
MKNGFRVDRASPFMVIDTFTAGLVQPQCSRLSSRSVCILIRLLKTWFLPDKDRLKRYRNIISYAHVRLSLCTILLLTVPSDERWPRNKKPDRERDAQWRSINDCLVVF